MIQAISAYCARYSIPSNQFIAHIQSTVEKGVVPNK
jgi:hypothetical protein